MPRDRKRVAEISKRQLSRRKKQLTDTWFNQTERAAPPSSADSSTHSSSGDSSDQTQYIPALVQNSDSDVSSHSSNNDRPDGCIPNLNADIHLNDHSNEVQNSETGTSFHPSISGTEISIGSVHADPNPSEHEHDVSQENSNPDPSDDSSSDNSSSNSSISIDADATFQDRLAAVIVKHTATEALTKDILSVIRSHPCLDYLPQTKKSLVKTSRESVRLKVVPPGTYYHFGLQQCIEQAIRETYIDSNDIVIIELDLSVDGVNVADSSASQFWPISGDAISLPGSEIFVVGTYHGQHKPENADLYLEDVVDDLIQLINNGFNLNGRIVPVRLKKFICDIPAKAFITKVKGHRGTCSCYKCTIPGRIINELLCFPEVDYPLRTDESFRTKTQPEHHHGTSILERIPFFNLIDGVVMDPMHLIDIGNVKKKLDLMFIAPRVKLPAWITDAVSETLLNLYPFIPCEFQRKPRCIRKCAKFKATECRQILLYTGPVAFIPMLQTVQGRDNYHHFLALHSAATILCTNNTNDLEDAQVLLESYIVNFGELHGGELISQNVHGLCHISKDVENHGALYTFSAYKFENSFRKMVHLLKKSNMPMQQFVKRTEERKKNLNINRAVRPSITFHDIHFDGPLLHDLINPQYRKVVLKTITLKNTVPNNCAILDNGSIVLIYNFATSATGIVAIVRTYSERRNLYIEPRPSSTYGIWEVTKLSQLSAVPVNRITNKCVRLPTSGDWFAIFPLRHLA